MKSVYTGSRNFQCELASILAILILLADCIGFGAILADENRQLFDGYKRIIVLDPGHGGRDFGARGPDGTTEKTVTLTLARLIAAELKREYKMVLTRADDYHVALVNRTAVANHLKADLFISVHTGGSFIHSTSGTIIYHYQDVSQLSSTAMGNRAFRVKAENDPIPWERIQNRYLENSRLLARLINARLSSMNLVKTSRIQGAPLAVLQGADMPAILIETGFLTNPAEEKNLRDQRFLRDLAAEISRGIEDYFSQKQK